MIKKILPLAIMVVIGAASFAVSMMVAKQMTSEQMASQTQAEQEKIETKEKDNLNELALKESTQLLPEQEKLRDLTNELRAKMRELTRREQEVAKRERQAKIAAADAAKQSEDLEKLRMDLIAALTPLKNAKADITRYRTLIKNQEVANLQSTAKMWSKMEPANVARVIVDMYQNDKAKHATKIIRFLSDKSWAAIMDEVTLLDMQSRQESGKSNAAVRIIIEQLKVIREQKSQI